MTTTEALIIFVRKPEKGKVKTRLAASVGDDAALAVYRQLLAHTRSVAAALTCDKAVFYAGDMVAVDEWNEGFQKHRQAEGDLGQKMKAAFAGLFQQGYTRVCIIGSDCFELNATIISNAFSALHQTDVVIGPATDGGYYLLGMRNGLKDVFEGIAWSTERVLAQTKALLQQHGYSFALLPLLTDVDTVDDLPDGMFPSIQQLKNI